MNRRDFIRKAIRAGVVLGATSPALVHAATPQHLNSAFFRKPKPAPSGGGAYTLITSASTNNADSSTSNVTSGIDTTGATLLVASVSTYRTQSDTAITDSKANTWTKLTEYGPTGDGRNYVTLFYCLSPVSVGSGHTFVVSVGNYPNIAVIAFSGGGSHTFDTSTGAAFIAGTSQQPGAISAVTSELLVTAGTNYVGFNFNSINSGFTIQENVTASAGSVLAMAFYSVASASSINPTWTVTGGGDGGTSMAGFK
jgi:hypothetical protein